MNPSDFLQGLTMTFLTFCLGVFFGWLVFTHPQYVDTWMNAHLHGIYTLYHTDTLCPDNFTCTPKTPSL